MLLWIAAAADAASQRRQRGAKPAKAQASLSPRTPRPIKPSATIFRNCNPAAIFLPQPAVKAQGPPARKPALLFQARPEPPMIAAKNLTRNYGSFTAVDHVSFTIGDGEIVGLLGHN